MSRKLDVARAALLTVRDKLDKVLPQASGPHDIADHLVCYAEEFGVDKTVAEAEANPGILI